MRKLLWIIISISVLWGGYWFVGSRAVERGVISWLDDTESRDWNINYAAANTTGFPNRFDTTVDGVTVTSADARLAWSAPFLQIFALSYKPNHIIAVWPNSQTVSIGTQKLAVTTDRMRGSVVFKPETALTLDRSSLEVKNFALQSNQGWSVAADALQLNTSLTATDENAQDVLFQVLKLRPSDRFMSALDPDGNLPAEFDAIRLDAALTFDAPWDRFAVDQQLPGLTDININRFQFQWGELDFRASGNLSLDGRGYVQGKLSVTAQNWREIYKILVRIGVVQGNFAGPIESFLQIMALETEDPNLLQADWVFKDGRMRIGAIPLGPAPRLRRR
ncbi:MAG: DUF2125 domain-containing protein [Paracoccaceae bacterium]